jgi:hypothetical protein
MERHFLFQLGEIGVTGQHEYLIDMNGRTPHSRQRCCQIFLEDMQKMSPTRPPKTLADIDLKKMCRRIVMASTKDKIILTVDYDSQENCRMISGGPFEAETILEYNATKNWAFEHF